MKARIEIDDRRIQEALKRLDVAKPSRLEELIPH